MAIEVSSTMSSWDAQAEDVADIEAWISSSLVTNMPPECLSSIEAQNGVLDDNHKIVFGVSVTDTSACLEHSQGNVVFRRLVRKTKKTTMAIGRPK